MKPCSKKVAAAADRLVELGDYPFIALELSSRYAEEQVAGVMTPLERPYFAKSLAVCFEMTAISHPVGP